MKQQYKTGGCDNAASARESQAVGAEVQQVRAQDSQAQRADNARRLQAVTCYYPIPGYQGGPGEPVRLHPPLGTATLSLRCGNCLGCRADRAREWGERCRHEAACWDSNIFATLTYDENHLPVELVPSHVQQFIRALRQRVKRGDPNLTKDPSGPIRYFVTGEYGELTERPHYHAILFNVRCADKEKLSDKLWKSPSLDDIWAKGHITCGDVTGASASYVAGYAAKKLVCDADGVLRAPPFLRASRKPGIGLAWVRTYGSDYESGQCLTVDGRSMAVPRYYRKKLAGSASGDALQQAVYERAKERGVFTPYNLKAREIIHEQRVRTARRS